MSIYTVIHKEAKLPQEGKINFLHGLKTVFGEDNSKVKEENKFTGE